jgi:hypothetical protein
MERAPKVGLLERVGLALTRPRAALAGADRPEAAGRSASDAVLLILLAALASSGQTLITAALIGDGQAALSMTIGAIAGRAAGPLAFLFAAALALFVLAGPRRSFGREIDLASVAIVPLVAIRLVGELGLRALVGTLGEAGAAPWLPLVIQVVAYAVAAAWLVPAVAVARRRRAS